MEYCGYKFYPNEYGGTMTEDEYVYLIDCLEEFCPNRICELGSGQSTLIFLEYCKRHDKTSYSIEHDESYKMENGIIYPLIENTSLTVNGCTFESCNIYDGFEEWLSKQGKFDFILVDGPIGCGHRELYTYSRVQLLSFALLDKISDNAVIMYHDSERGNAKTTLNEFEKLLSERNFKFKKELINENNTRELTIYNIEK